MSNITSKLKYAVERAKAGAPLDPCDTSLMEGALEEIERLSKLRVAMHNQLEVFAYFAQQMPTPTIGQPDWHGMAKSAREITQPDIQPAAKIHNEWMVVSTVISEGWLMLKCKVTGKEAFIKNPTKAEWATAFHAPSQPYLWEDQSRVELKETQGETAKKEVETMKADAQENNEPKFTPQQFIHQPTSETIHEKMCELETNLNHVLEHIREGLAGGNFGSRAREIKRHALAAKNAFDWLDNFTITNLPPTQEGPTITRQWMDWCGVADMRDITASPKFKKLIDHPDFKTARGWLIHGQNFIVIGDESWWGWETPGGSCMLAGTLFPSQ